MSDDQNRPNILFLLSDEHSFRYVSARTDEEGGEACRTPTLDRLAGQGVDFIEACCHAPVCVPSRISLLSGRYTHHCPVLWPDTPTIASHLGAHGYATAAVGKMHIIGSNQFAGFDDRPYGDFDAPSPAHQKDPLFLPGTRDHIFMPSVIEDAGLSDIPESLLQEQFVVRESTAWLREQNHKNADQPWLLYASFGHPHFPMNAPRRFFERYFPDGVTPPRIGATGDARSHPAMVGALRADGAESQGHHLEDVTPEQTLRARAAYAACVDHLDEIIGDFLALLDRDGLLENTVIVYTSDHGELAGEHGLWFKRTWHEASVRVPMIISLPEHRRGDLEATRVDTPVSLVDAFPTLCGLAGIPAPPQLDGIDLSPVVRGEPCEALQSRPGVIVEHLARFNEPGTEYRMVRSHGYKYVAFRGCDDLAYDLSADPDEQHNLAGEQLPEDLLLLKEAVLDGFDFDAATTSASRERSDYRRKYPSRVSPKTSNQIFRGDGTLVETDGPLDRPDVVSEDPRLDFDDFPDQRRPSRRRR